MLKLSLKIYFFVFLYLLIAYPEGSLVHEGDVVLLPRELPLSDHHGVADPRYI